VRQKDIERALGRLVERGFKDPDINLILTYIELLEDTLDRLDEEDALGTEGWRHHLGLED
jgi:hypothetical protein